LAKRQQRAEIRVDGNHGVQLAGGAIEDGLVGRGMHPIVENMYGIVAGRVQPSGHARRERIVDEELHVSRGIIRSRTASAAY
jgi:hypothetical protein